MNGLRVESSKSKSSKASSAVHSTAAAAKTTKPARAAAKKASYVDLVDRSALTACMPVSQVHCGTFMALFDRATGCRCQARTYMMCTKLFHGLSTDHPLIVHG